MNKHLKSTSIVKALIKIQEDILKHPNTIMCRFDKNTAPLSASPKKTQHIKVFYVHRSDKLTKSIWRWVFDGDNPKKLKMGGANQKALFKAYKGIPKKTIGLTSPIDLISIDKVKRLKHFRSAREFTMTANLLQHSVVNKEVLEVLNYMGKTGKSYGKSKLKYDLNQKGCFGIKDPKKGIVYPAFLEDRKCTNCFLPLGYPYPYPREDIALGRWLINRYKAHKLRLNEVLIGGVGAHNKGPIHRVLSEKKHRTTNSILATFGLVLNTLGAKGVAQLAKQHQKDPKLNVILKDISKYLSLL